MTTLITAFAAAVIPSLFCGIVLGVMNRKADQRYEQDQEAAKERAEAARLQMQMIMATASLSYACGLAIKNGKINGELSGAMEEYEACKKAYMDHINTEFFKAREKA